MSSILKKRKLVALLGVVAAVGIAAVAYAYLTASGSGSGSGSAAADTADLVLSSDSPAASLTHIGDSATITIYAANPDSDSPEVLDSSNLTASTVTATGTAPSGKTCPAGSFSISDVTTTGNEVAAGATDVVVGHATVTWENVSEPQNDCTGFDLSFNQP